MHARETIRKAITSAVTGLTTTGLNVFTDYQYPFSDDELPSLSVYVARTSEEVDDDGEMGTYQLRHLPVSIVGRTAAIDGLSDVLDDICAEVETALAGSSTVSALVKDCSLVTTEVELDNSGDKPIGGVTMEWIFTYRVDGSSPTIPVQ